MFQGIVLNFGVLLGRIELVLELGDEKIALCQFLVVLGGLCVSFLVD